jgi:hypothetical protein
VIWFEFRGRFTNSRSGCRTALNCCDPRDGGVRRACVRVMPEAESEASSQGGCGLRARRGYARYRAHTGRGDAGVRPPDRVILRPMSRESRRRAGSSTHSEKRFRENGNKLPDK